MKFQKSFDPCPPMQIFRVSAQKSIKIRERSSESFEVGQDLEHDEIGD
jgi:hypothetical protein